MESSITHTKPSQSILKKAASMAIMDGNEAAVHIA